MLLLGPLQMVMAQKDIRSIPVLVTGQKDTGSILVHMLEERMEATGLGRRFCPTSESTLQKEFPLMVEQKLDLRQAE